MTTTSSVSSNLLTSMNNASSTTAANKTPTDSTDSASGIENRFLKMLVAQMKNQDPLNPMDNAAVTSQMAQLSTVTGINKLNDTLNSMKSNFASNEIVQASDMIGHGVFVSGSTVKLNTSTDSSGTSASSGLMGVKLDSDADHVVVTVKDSAGKTVYTSDLGSQSAGIVPISWDGSTDSGSKADAGKYTFSISATKSGAAVNATTLSFDQVVSVTGNSSGVTLNTANAGDVNLSNILQVY